MDHSHSDPGFVDMFGEAFHGTSLGAARRILSTQFEIGKGKEYHLGVGAYFYERSFKSAKGWAEKVRKYNEPAVIASRIEVRSCLDFTDEAVQEEAGRLAHTLALKGRPQTFSSLIALLCNRMKADTVKAIQVAPDASSIVYSSDDVARKYPRVRVIICVKNVACIVRSELRYPKAS